MASHPTTDNFPIPPDLEGFWQWDKMHCPRPQTVLTHELFGDSVSEGFTRGMTEFACPVGVTYRSINTHGYMAIVPQDLGGESQDERIARYQQTVQEMLPRIGDLWHEEWLPSLLPDLEISRSTDYSALGDDALMGTLDRMLEEFIDHYTIHGKINFIAVAASLFADFYNEQFSPDDPTEPYAALQGFPTRSVDAGQGLWRLSRTIKNSATLTTVFDRTDAPNIMERLAETEEGQEFLKDFRVYLDEFGWRGDAFELSDPTWREEPTIPLNTLQGYMRLDDDHDPELKLQEAVDVREKLLAQARERLAGDPESMGEFNSLYEMARHYLVLTEDHNYYIDQVGNGVMRLPVLEIGQRLAANGALDGPGDVFHLRTEEIKQALAGADHRSLVVRRKADLEEWAKVVPVPTIGEPPPPNEDPLGAAFGKMFGMPPEPSRDPDVINGIGASRGTVQGKAKVVRNLTEASKVEPGDILVCEMTMPPWTPLFSTVAAVVADTGGVLSHCAIVAREYGLPCVVSTIVGTGIIEDGMTLTVDGSSGIVRIDSRT